MNFYRNCLGATLICLVNLNFLEADNRAYVWTYEYKTMEAGEAEVEYYTTFHSPYMDSLTGTVTAEHNIELEIGMTDHFDIGLYQVFEQEPNAALSYKGFKIRGRYRFGETGRLPVDPLLYVEYKGRPDFSKHVWEFKVILARDFGRLNVAFNPVFELESEEDGWEQVFKYNLGISYRLHDLVGLGLEAKGSSAGHYLGPVISHGKGNLWVALGSGFAISSISADKPEFMLRLIVGVGLSLPSDAH